MGRDAQIFVNDDGLAHHCLVGDRRVVLVVPDPERELSERLAKKTRDAAASTTHLSVKHLVNHDAETENVRGVRVHIRAEGLGGHVSDRPALVSCHVFAACNSCVEARSSAAAGPVVVQLPRRLLGVKAERAGEPEVGEDEVVLAGDEDVAWLDVAVEDAALVELLQSKDLHSVSHRTSPKKERLRLVPAVLRMS